MHLEGHSLGRRQSRLTFRKFFIRQKEALASALPLYEAQLQLFHTSFDTQMRRLHLGWLRQSETRDGEAADVADLLKHRFAGVLLDQLLQGRGEGYDTQSIRWARALVELIKDALLLNAEVSCAREKYSFYWPASGTAFDARSMEGTYGAGEVVVVTMFPGLMMQSNDSNEVIAKAWVKAA